MDYFQAAVANIAPAFDPLFSHRGPLLHRVIAETGKASPESGTGPDRLQSAKHAISAIGRAARLLREARDQQDAYLAKEVSDIAAAAVSHAGQHSAGTEFLARTRDLKREADRILAEICGAPRSRP